MRLAPLPQRPEEAAPPLAYSLAPGLVSVLDGFVDPDFDLVAPRGPGEL